jgi:hypothetical protein
MAGDPELNSAEVTTLLARISDGDPHAGDALFSRLQSELRRVAARQMERHPSAHTLQPTRWSTKPGSSCSATPPPRSKAVPTCSR